MTPKRAETPRRSGRRGEVLSLLRGTLAELSGSDLADVDDSSSFLELGFDSLFLTQASAAIRRRFGVKVSFRQLMDEVPTLEALAAYLDAVLPTGSFGVAAREEGAAPGAGPASVDEASSVSALDRLHEQLAVLSRQVEALRAAGSWETAVSAAAVSEPPKRFGPHKPIQRGAGGVLTSRQREHLDGLIARYTRRTGESKRLTQAYRRAFADPRAVAGFRPLWKEMVYPIVAKRAKGSRLWDVDGNEYVDLTMGFGVNLFGHSPDFVIAAIEEQLAKGIEIGPQALLAGEVAERICALTGMERATFCNTGSEAVLAAMRLARTVTGRAKIALFSDSYHGLFDEVLVRAARMGGPVSSVPIAPGIPAHAGEEILVLEYGHPESLEVLKKNAGDLAAVLVEPVQSRRPDVQPAEFLRELRRWTESAGVALIFDETITGFRIHPGGAQAYFGVGADIATYGKVLGGGMPIGVVAGKAPYMDALDGGMWSYGDASAPPSGVTFFAGTFVRHPLALAAARAVLDHLERSGPALQEELNRRTAQFAQALNDLLARERVPFRIPHFSSFLNFPFDSEPRFGSLFFFHLREKGVHVWEGRPGFLSTAHTDEDLDRVLSALSETIWELREGGFVLEDAQSGDRDVALVHPIRRSSSEEPLAPRSPLPSASGPGPYRLPLTEAQRELWLAAQLGDAASRAYNESLRVDLRGPFDPAAMRNALRRLVDRHEALRTTFASDGEFQEILPTITLEIPMTDLSSSQGTGAEALMEGLFARDSDTPFDLVGGPLLRARIVRLNEQHHVLSLTVHHIICDGWSFSVLLEELGQLCSAERGGAGPALSTPMRFRDYAQWLARQEREPEMRATESYWQEQFRGPVPILELPADRPRPLVKTYRGARLARTIHPFLFKALQRLAARHGCTLLTTLLTGFALLLHRLTRQDDIVVGLPTAGQALVDARSLVGHCVNFLALRTRIAGDPTVAEALVSMKRTVLDAYDHQNYTLGALLRTLNLGRDASRVPLVNATLNLDRDLEPPRFHGLEAVVSKNPTGFVKFDLDCNFIETRSALELECEYNTDLFDARTVERWLGHFETLLSGMAADSARRISELPLLTPGERQEMATAWNDTRTDYPTDVCLHELFEAQVERTPGAVAAVFGSERVTYRELSTRANELAHRLRTLGVGPEVLVAICVTRSVEALVGLLGILKAGGAYVPLDPSYPKDRLAFMMEESRASVLLTERRYAKSFPSRGFQTLCLDEGRKTLRSARAQAPLARATPRNLAYVLFTSGSTGWPKGVAIEHRSVVALLDWAKRVFAPGDLAGVLASTSLSFDLSVFELFVPWSAGGKVILVKDILQLPQLSSRAEVTLVNTVPSAIAELLRADSLPASVRTVNLAGEPLQNSLVQRIYSQVSVGEVYNLYGPTESTTYSTFARARREAAETPSIGHPIANSEVYLLDARLEPVPVGVPGELYIGGAGLARGYQNRPELTAENFLANPFCVEAGSRMYRTGDLARYLVNGEIEFLGRVDNQVKVRGFRIELGEIETVLAQYPSVRESAVVAREDIAGEKRLVAYVVFGRGPAPTTEALRSFLREKLPGHMIPSAFSVLGALPRTPNGKIDRAALPAAGQTRPESEKRYLAPRDSLERQLVEIWERVLRIRPIGIDDNFFELGGHSLLVVRLFGRVEKIARRKLPLATIFQAPTVRDLAAVLHQEGWTPSWSSLVPIQPAGGRPPFYCVHAAGGNVLTYRDLARHLGPDQPVYGLQAQGLGGNLPPQTRVEDMAAHYIREIRNLQAEGSYFLGGSSFGGMVAFEMARQLQAAGQEVGVLALFDTYGPDYPKPLPGTSRLWLRMYAIVERFDLHIGNLLVARPREKMDYLKEKSKRLRKRIRTRFRKLKRYPLPRALREVENATRQAIINYVPKIYSGRITLFRASKQPAGFFPDPELGWGAVAAGGVDVHEVPGYHGAIVYEPRIRVLAEQLRICLEKANAAKEETTEGRLSAAIQ